MKKIFILFTIVISLQSKAQNVGIGTSTPAVRLAVDSSIMVDQANSNQGFLDRSSLYFGSDKKVISFAAPNY